MAGRTPKKKALLVGINNFLNVNGLQGCVNDSLNMKSLLTTLFGFSATNIHQLANNKATKANILKELQWLLRDSVAGDHLVFHYSSHGSQVPDTNGDEGDGMDEILCCYDMDWDGHGYITDDELAAIAQHTPPGVVVEAFFDTCFSGTGQSITPRGALIVEPVRTSGAEDRVTMPVRRPLSTQSFRPVGSRYLTPPSHIMAMMEGRTKVNRLLTPLHEGVADRGLKNFQALWSGCGEEQTSADAFISGKYNGAFTFYWCEAVRSLSGRISRNDILKRLRDKLVRRGYDQIPELMCSTQYASQFLLL